MHYLLRLSGLCPPACATAPPIACRPWQPQVHVATPWPPAAGQIRQQCRVRSGSGAGACQAAVQRHLRQQYRCVSGSGADACQAAVQGHVRRRCRGESGGGAGACQAAVQGHVRQ
eukprot:1152225-Pelagomonas_calceolata.AAC.4